LGYQLHPHGPQESAALGRKLGDFQ